MKYTVCLLLGLALGVGYSFAEAKMCKGINAQGEEVFMWSVDAKTGKLLKTLNASGAVATMEACPVNYNLDIPAQSLTGVKLLPKDIRGVTVESQPQVLPEDRNAFIHEACKRTLDTVCDPQYGGIKLYTNPEVKNGIIEQNCIGLTIKSGQPADSADVYYAVPMMYSGVKPDGTCVFDK